MSTSPTTRMPRAQRRTQLLELATQVFTQNGYHGTSMDDIAAAAGVTKPVLYQHFDSKVTLYLEVIDIISVGLLAEVRSIGSFEGDTSQRVRYGLTRFYELISVQNALRLFTGNESISDEVQERAGAVLDQMAIELAEVLTAFREMSTAQSRIIGRGLISVTQTTALLLHEARDEADREATLEVMSAFTVQGLTAFTPLEGPASSGSALGADGSSST